jgi:amino acid transporter
MDQSSGKAAQGGVGRGAERYKLSVVSGLAALSLDAMASVAYGPEAIVLVLATAGGVGLGYTLPVTLAIAGLLAVLTFSYRQIIAAYPGGGGAYGVAKSQLGTPAGLVAAASLVIDYVLNVAVSIAAGGAALTAAFPALQPYLVEICLAALLIVTLVNLRGIAHSARAFIGPTVVFVVSVLVVIVVGLFRDAPAAGEPVPGPAPGAVQTVGLLLLRRAFSNGCASLTGVEAIANAVPAFRSPAVRNAQRAETALGVLLAVLLIGVAVLIEKFQVHPVEGTTVLAQVTRDAIGGGIGFYVVQFATVVLLALAANTSFGGLPVLARLLASDHYLPHVFALRADRQVYRYGVVVLAVSSGVILVVARAQVNRLVPLFAIGVFVGFTLAQTGMVRHWLTVRSAGWRWRAALNGLGATLTGLAAVVTTVSKFAHGAWAILLALPLLVLGFERVHGAYRRIGAELGIGHIPRPPAGTRSVVIVPVHSVSNLAREAISAAISLGDEVVAVRVVYPDEPADLADFRREWEAWRPDVPLVLVSAPHRDIGAAVTELLNSRYSDRRTFVLIAEIEPEHRWERILRNNRGSTLARAIRRRTNAIVCRLYFKLARLSDEPQG